jgi:SAM-dependent methyltransferase
VTSPTDPSIAEVVAGLRRELDRLAPAAPGSSAWVEENGQAPPARVASVADTMEAALGITSDHPATTQPGVLAPLRLAVKRVLRKALRWYVEPVAADARRFAGAATGAARLLETRIGDVERRVGHTEETQAATVKAAVSDIEREIAALRDRLGRIERSRDSPAPAASALTPEVPAKAAPRAQLVPSGPPAGFDYFAFEALMRGSREEIAARQRGYLDAFAKVDDILDAGCGRGEFLLLLRDAGKTARGVDIDPDMVGQARAQGLDVVQGDAIECLAGLDSGSIGGVFAAQVVEHLRPDRLVAFLAASARALRPGGVIVLETINPASLSALRNYFADLTHAQPLVAETLAFLVESAGFRDVRVELTSPVPDAGRLIHIPYEASVPESARMVSDRNVDLLNALLFAPQDYAVVARA